MLKIKDQVFGENGYSTALKLSSNELSLIRKIVLLQWSETISSSYPKLANKVMITGIENYHLISDQIDHKNIWKKSNRILSKENVSLIKKLPFYMKLKKEFGEFSISDIYDTFQHHDEEEIYWRLVRPGIESDVGPLHADKWFHNSFNTGLGMFSKDQITLKVWVPLYCEPGKSGLAIVEGSHSKEWPYKYEETDGSKKPVPDVSLNKLNAKLIVSSPGDVLIFHENTLHKGVINLGTKTRVSIEITMVMPR